MNFFIVWHILFCLFIGRYQEIAHITYLYNMTTQHQVLYLEGNGKKRKK